jgi:L-threonylcarbamoyladenylate synthase
LARSWSVTGIETNEMRITRQYGVAPMHTVADAVAALRAGELVAFPTETVYGLGADASNADAVHRLFVVKGRPADHPVIVHIARAAQLDELGRAVPDVAHRLADAFWPGALTIVVVRDATRVADAVTGGRATVGLRVPDHPVARQLLDEFGGGVAAPSANRFGRVSPTTAAHVRADLGADVRVVLDGGPSRVGVESTIVDVTGDEPAVLRVGGISRTDLERVVARPIVVRTQGEVAAPGTKQSHYAPRAAVEIVTPSSLLTRAGELREAGRRVGLLALAADLPERADGLIVLDAPADVDEFARVLYERLRAADDRQLDVLLVVSPRDADGLGAAVADRVWRASH